MTLRVLIVALALYVLVDGVIALTSAFKDSSDLTTRSTRVIEGAAGIIAGLIVLFWPDLTSQLLLYFIAGWALVTGVSKLVAAARHNDLLMMITGGISVLFGLLILPIGGDAVSAVQFIAVFAIIYGFLMLVKGFQLRTQ
jgi:uncharacterized membrane protein HdeD (DUF308 family)